MIVSTFLSEPEQREAFAVWLCRIVAASGQSKGKISAALGYDTTGQLNRYLRGIVFPTAKSAAIVATCCGVSRLEAFWRGGFYRELFAEVTALATTPRRRHQVAEGLIACFPRRGDRYRSTLPRAIAHFPDWTLGWGAPDNEPELSGELARASDIAYDTTLPHDVRRAIIAELCDSWARSITSPQGVDGCRSVYFSERATVDTPESLMSYEAAFPRQHGKTASENA